MRIISIEPPTERTIALALTVREYQIVESLLYGNSHSQTMTVLNQRGMFEPYRIRDALQREMADAARQHGITLVRDS